MIKSIYYNFDKKKIIIISILILALIFTIKNYTNEIGKVVIPLKHNILMMSIDDKIALLKSSGNCVYCNFNQANISGVDFKYVDLRYANLTKTDLSGADLSGADLSNTNLKGANLSRADLISANLTGANLINAILVGADLNSANLSGVDLTKKDLTGAKLIGVDLTDKDLTGTKLTKVEFTGANLSGVDLSDKDLTGAKLIGVDLSNKDLTGSILTNIDFTGTNLSGVDLSDKDLTGSILTRVNFKGANLKRADLSGTNLTGANLNGANLSGTNLTGANLSRADLSGINLTDVNLSFADLSRANLTGVNLSEVDLIGVNLTGTNLINTNFSKTDLSKANLTLAKIIRPSAPTNLQTTEVEDDFISVTWMDNTNGELEHDVYISSGRKPDLPYARVAAGISSFTFKNLKAENYRIWIEAAGKSLKSDALIGYQGTKRSPKNHLKVDKSRGEWSLIVIPDTQEYHVKVNQESSGKFFAPFSNMVDAFDWIVLVADDLNIKMVQGLGDITENQNNVSEWENASETYYKLKGKVAFVPNIGNKDSDESFKYYFPESRFENETWWGGNYNGIMNSYQLMTIGNEDYLFLNIELNPQAIYVDWAKNIIDSHQDRKIILATHDIIEFPTVRNEIIRQHDNIVLTNAGHVCREIHFIENGPGEGVSNNFVANYSCDSVQNMLLRFYVFKPLEDKVYFYTYSPITNEFEVDDTSQGSFDLVQKDP